MKAHLSTQSATATLFAAVIALTAAAPGLAAVPQAATYSGTGVSSAGTKAKVKLEMTRSRRGRVHVKILKAIDGCFGPSTEGARTRVRNGHFAAGFGGGKPASGFADEFSGRFFGSRSGSVQLHTVFWNYPATGPATTCDVTSTIAIHKLRPR